MQAHLEQVWMTESTKRRTERTVAVIGIGGAGCRAVSDIAEPGGNDLTTVCIDTDSASLDRSVSDERVLLGAAVMRGFGSGGDATAVGSAAVGQETAIRQLVAGAQCVVVIAGLAGGTGSGAAPVVADICRSAGALVVSVALMPMEFESLSTHLRAADALARLKAASDLVFEAPRQSDSRSRTISDALHDDRRFAQSVAQNLARYFESQNTDSGADVSHLRAILRDGASAVFSQGDFSADAVAAAESCMASLDTSGRIERAVVLVESLRNLPVMELNRLTESVESHIGRGVELLIIFKPTLSHAPGIRISLTGALREHTRRPAMPQRSSRLRIPRGHPSHLRLFTSPVN